MKKLHSILAILLVMVCSMSFTSCSNDDDEEGGGNSNINTCYVKVDGKQHNFKYAYYYEETGDWEREIEFTFSSVDLLNYIQNPFKVKKGTLTTIAYIEFDVELTSGTTTNYDFEVEHNVDLYFVINNPDELEEEWQPDENYHWYANDWDQENTPLTITKSGFHYKMSASSVPMMVSVDGWFDSMETYRKTTADFYFDGIPTDINNLKTSEYAKSVTVVKVDKPTMQWLKKMRRNK